MISILPHNYVSTQVLATGKRHLLNLVYDASGQTEFNNGTGIGKMQVCGHGLCGTGKRQVGSFGQFARGGHLVLGDFKADNKELFRAIFSPFRTGGSRIKREVVIHTGFQGCTGKICQISSSGG